jgi:hypothetical protein
MRRKSRKISRPKRPNITLIKSITLRSLWVKPLGYRPQSGAAVITRTAGPGMCSCSLSRELCGMIAHPNQPSGRIN